MLAAIVFLELPRLSGITPILNTCEQASAVGSCPAFVGVDGWHPRLAYKRLDLIGADAAEGVMPKCWQVHIVA